MKREKRNSAILMVITIGVITILVFPIYWTFHSSVTPTQLILSRTPPVLPANMSFQAYSEIISRRPVFLWLYNTMLVSFGATCFSLVLSILAGYSLSRFRTHEIGRAHV